MVSWKRSTWSVIDLSRLSIFIWQNIKASTKETAILRDTMSAEEGPFKMFLSYLFILVHWPSMWIYFSNYSTDRDKNFPSPSLMPREKGKMYLSSLCVGADYCESTCQHTPICHLSPPSPLFFIVSTIAHRLCIYLSSVYLYISSSCHLSALALFFGFEFWKYSCKSNLEGKGLTWLTIPGCSASLQESQGGKLKHLVTSHTQSRAERETNASFSLFCLLYTVQGPAHEIPVWNRSPHFN